MSDVMLRNAQVTFHTLDDDKDHDTHVTITVRNRDGIIVARIDNDFGHFTDRSDNGPFALMIINQASKTTLESGGTTTIRVDPNGNDTWRFNFELDLMFSDSSRLTSDANGLELNDERQQQTFAVH